MASATQATHVPEAGPFTHADAFHAAAAQDALELAGQLADAFDILMQCRARNVALSEEFLAYVDDLMESIDSMQPWQMLHRA